MASIYSPTFDEDTSHYASVGYRCQRARLGYQAGCEQLGLSLWELAPGAEGTNHYHYANEELLIVLAGRPSLLTPTGWRELAEGEVVAFPRGARGAHAPANRTEEPIRLLFFSEMRGPDVVIYPHIGVVAVLEEMSSPERGGLAVWLRLEDALERHEGAEVEAASSPATMAAKANLLTPKFDAPVCFQLVVFLSIGQSDSIAASSGAITSSIWLSDHSQSSIGVPSGRVRR